MEITNELIIKLLEKSLYEPYQINPDKFDVKALIKKYKIVDPTLLEQFRQKIEYKVNKQKRNLNNIFIDFGAFTLQQNWTADFHPDLNLTIKETNRKDVRS